ncbi:uncharacterized protein LOC129306423 [Prosopis cineraria]|uniref:uncharacterized protein LOC129306423 n=1 Tax=Prosopis cineraria TaxID=364024 RepID=UPI00240FAE08|nr:uncharacterized protein LOC129306423 [Prosopis cineraria]
MRTLAPLQLPLLGFPQHLHSPTQPRVSYPSLSPHSSSTLSSPKIPNKTLAFRLNSNDPKESLFFDENGAVEDMEGYLDQLSLEYDSVWDTKPSWCQPWTITLTGILMIATSWLILRSVAVTSVILLLISAWWYMFLYSYPKAYSEMIAERRERVTSGAEDTFGRKKKQ